MLFNRGLDPVFTSKVGGMNKMKCYAVMGHPIEHSLSPKLHAKFAQDLGLSLSYDAIDVPVDNFPLSVKRFFEVGDGLNVTLPFKQQAFEMADTVSERARLAQSVNTLWIGADRQLYGDNTDGVGFVTDLVHNLNIPIKQQRILVMGAGGAVRGVLKPLLDAEPACITLVNRTHERAKDLAARFSAFGPVHAMRMQSLSTSYDLVINGTSSGFTGQIPLIPSAVIDSTTSVYDMAYGEKAEGFIQWALSEGTEQAFDGLGMLVEQAAEAFRIWHGVRPCTKNMVQYLRDRL